MSSLNIRLAGRARPRVGRHVGAFVGLATAVLVLTGCDLPWSSTPTAEAPEIRPSELTDAGGQSCPQDLPIGDDPSGHGFGTEEVADEVPALLKPQKAWVCQYNAVDIGRTSSGGTTYGWSRAAQAEPVAESDLPALQVALDDLAPAEGSRACTADLGPRWMLVYVHDGDLTGVVVDDYGCREVRLTDNPHDTPPGANKQDGTVSGVLDGGVAILDALGVGRSS